MNTTPKTSRAACMTGFQIPLEIRDVPIPDEIEPGAILVKNEVASICGSDVHLWQGALGDTSFLQLPAILGHEMMGRVVRLGPGVQTDTAGQALAEGDRIMRSVLRHAFFVEKHMTVIGVLSGDTDHYYKALQFLQLNRGRFHFEDRLSNRYRLDQINEALAAMQAFREIKPVVIL